MQFGFMRSSPAGPTIKAQQAALAAIGLDDFSEAGPVFVDDRKAALTILAPGDVLVVASAACLGTTSSDVLTVLAEVSRRRASVLDAATGIIVSCPPAVLPALDFANRADSENKRAIAAKARRERAASGRVNQWPGWDAKRIKRLMDMEAEGTLSRDEMAAELGTSRATVQRKLRELNSR